MQRSQLYLTSVERAALKRRAADEGVSVAEVVRGILDRELGIHPGPEHRLAVIDATAGILRGAPDWPQWLAGVRGAEADTRLRDLEP